MRTRKVPLLHASYITTVYHVHAVDPDGPVVIILASGSEVRRLDPGQVRWIFLERKNPEYDFLRKGSKAVGPRVLDT